MAAHLADEDIEVPSEIANLCYFEDGVLYAAKEAITNSRVIEFEMWLMRNGRIKRKQQVSLADIAQKRSGHIAHSRRTIAGQELRMAMGFLDQAVKLKASDIHFVFRGPVMEVKYRVDGYLDKYAEMPAEDGMRVVSALYVECDVKNKGSFSFNSPIAARLTKGLVEELYAVRFASMKSDMGGVVVLRLLYNTVANRTYGKSIDLDVLGFNAQQIKLLQDMASAPNGLIIIDGPTGAGKSTTLKYVLQWVHERYPQLNILTVEDPPEYPIVGAQQLPVLVQDDDTEDLMARSRAYANVINTTLRLDPDILMVGEIRDGTSAISALRAAITGHRLWTTIHANDAWEAVNRLLDLLREGGMIDPLPVLANTQNLTGLIAQRLVPLLCPHCKVPLSKRPDALDPDVMNELLTGIPNFNPDNIYLVGDGCEHCVPGKSAEEIKTAKRRGIAGRTVVAEIVKPDQGLLDVARERGIPAARAFWLEHRGGRTLVDHALDKIAAGLIAPDVARDFIGPLVSSRELLSQMKQEGLR